MRLRILGCFIVIIVFGCEQKKAGETKQNKDWQTLSEAGYYIEYPPTWYLDKNKNLGTSFILFSRDASGEKFRENVNLVIQDLKGQNFNLDKYVELSEQQVSTMVRNSQLIESKRIDSGDNEYHQIVYSGDHQNYHLKWKQFYWVINDKAYVLTFTGTQETYDEYIPTADKIFNSFTFTKED